MLALIKGITAVKFMSTEEIYMLTFELFYRYEVAVGTTPGGGQIKPFFGIPVNTQYYTVTGLALDGLSKVKRGGYHQIVDRLNNSSVYL
jgi:hypothetical protein